MDISNQQQGQGQQPGQQGQDNGSSSSSCRIVMVSCGEAHTVAAAADGRVFTCGSNRAGALGHGDTVDRLIPEAIQGLNLRAMPKDTRERSE